MEAAERDTTDEWRIAPGRAPATVAELEGRIDVAIATARSAEEAALEIGAASLEAAEQARRAAALAERASASAARAAESAANAPSPAPQPILRSNGATPRRPDPFEERITAFRRRAEKVMIRLQKLEAGAVPGEPSEVVRLR
jgi:hypothetical protein